jgi:hypothetical protein
VGWAQLMGKDQMAYRNSVAIVENFWNEVWKQPRTRMQSTAW